MYILRAMHHPLSGEKLVTMDPLVAEAAQAVVEAAARRHEVDHAAVHVEAVELAAALLHVMVTTVLRSAQDVESKPFTALSMVGSWRQGVTIDAEQSL